MIAKHCLFVAPRVISDSRLEDIVQRRKTLKLSDA
jgi:hypothetical protein